MSLRKKKPAKTLSDKISDMLMPQPLLDPEIDTNDETAAKERYYEDDDDDEVLQVDQRLSEIRKKNVKLLQDVDQKYSGKISSRRDFEESDEEDQYEDSDEEDEKEDESADSDDDDVEDEEELQSDVDASVEEEAAASDEEVYEDSSDEEVENDNDAAGDSDSDINGHSGGEDDDAEADSDEEEEDDNDDDDEEDDDDESDFDGGDIDLAPKKASKPDADEPEEDAANPTMKPANLTADIQKGNCIQNQLHIWEKLLEVRIHSQKVLIKANSLPSFGLMESFIAENSEFNAAVEKTNANVDKLLSKLTEMQSLLTANYPETKDLNPRKRKHDRDESTDSSKVAKYSELLTDRFDAYKDYRNSVLLKWYDRTKVLTPGTKEGKYAAQHNILQNISGILANRSDLVKKTQLHKGGYEIVGAPKIRVAPPSENNEDDPDRPDENGPAEPEQFYSAEIYDDTDFYHTQLRELIEFKANSSSNPSEMNRQFVELQKLRKKIKKVVDTRASKGRKIRYVVHNKMVNFMARNDTCDWTDEGKTELYSSLFGARME